MDAEYDIGADVISFVAIALGIPDEVTPADRNSVLMNPVIDSNDSGQVFQVIQ